jgi:hypothetical protein
VTIRGQGQYLWRATDHDGHVIDILLQPRRDRHAAARFFRKLLKRSGRVPHRLVTDRFGSYRAAHRVIMPSVVHDTTRYANNRAEVSHHNRPGGASGICGALNRWHRPSGSSRSTTSFATCSPLDDIGFAPAISDFCARARSLRGTPWQRPDDFGVEIIPNVAVVDVNLTVHPQRQRP